jgi:hypothetical protein
MYSLSIKYNNITLQMSWLDRAYLQHIAFISPSAQYMRIAHNDDKLH